jgi:hypothetical protein
MRSVTMLAPVLSVLALLACDPTPQSGTPTTGCQFAAQQTSQGLRMNCTVTGQLPNALIDPLNPTNTSCAPASVSLFSQTVNVPIAVIYGENGDENSDRVRLGASVMPSTHSAKLAKAAGNSCDSTIGPIVDVGTAFAGRHIALVDKSQTPACVFESRLDLTTFNQTVSAGLNLDVSAATRETVREQLAKRLDLELASAVNRLLQPSSNIAASAFRARAGRCINDYREFAGN